MPQETINLLIGAAIALLSSAITSIISHFLQAHRDNQAKKWEIEKQNHEESKILIIKRLDTFEVSASIIVQSILSAYNTLFTVFSQSPDIEGLKDFRASQFGALFAKRIELIANAGYFHDLDLLDAVKEVYEVAGRLGNFFDEIIESIKDKDNAHDRLLAIREQLDEFGIEISNVIDNLHVKTDLVRINAIEKMQHITKMDEVMSDLKNTVKRKKQQN